MSSSIYVIVKVIVLAAECILNPRFGEDELDLFQHQSVMALHSLIR